MRKLLTALSLSILFISIFSLPVYAIELDENSDNYIDEGYLPPVSSTLGGILPNTSGASTGDVPKVQADGSIDYETEGSSAVEDDAYGSGWNGDTSHAPSQNALYDIMHLWDTDDDGVIDSILYDISDDAYAAGWNGDTDSGASKNAIYDKIESLDLTDLADGPGTYSGAGSYLVGVKATEDGFESVNQLLNVKIPVTYDSILAGNSSSDDVDEVAVAEYRVVGRASGGHVDDIQIDEDFVTAGADLVTDALIFVFKSDSALTTAEKIRISLPYSCTIKEWTILAEQDTTATIDIWVDTYANYPPDNSDSITASATPATTAASKNSSSTLTGWTTALTAGDTIIAAIEQNDNALELTLIVRVEK